MRTRIEPISPNGATVTWVRQYHDQLHDTGQLGNGAISEITRCTDAAFDRIPAPAEAGVNRRVAGVIVGAIQSGKTALMINLAARALDDGFRVILVLAGLRDDLRTQTAMRFVRDLLQRGDEIPGTPFFTHPEGVGYHGRRRDCWAPLVANDVNQDDAFVSLFRSQLGRGRGVLAVAKKNMATLNRLREAYEFACGKHGAEATPLFVLDDECDEASVSGAPDAPTPDRIARIWEGLGSYVTYVGLTATPAANLLQETSSGLFPKDFVLTLRTPGDSDSVLTFLEPDPDRRYTGGHAFYDFLESRQQANFLVRTRMSGPEFAGTRGRNEELEEALIAYFVAGAMRLLELSGCSFEEPGRLPRPHSMLAHTEVLVESHWELCERVMALTQSKAGRVGSILRNVRRIPPHRRLDPSDLRSWLAAEPERWRTWYDEYVRSRQVLLEANPDRDRGLPPSWPAVLKALAEVFRFTKLRVLNSDESSVDPPLSFEPTFGREGVQPPEDVYSIIIGGNRLSRGLTLKGLCTAYYTRSATQVLEDTTVQRERWFGYRGEHLEFCRVFTHRTLALHLRRFHEHDEDLRRQLAWNISHDRSPVNATYRFLTTGSSLPTAKLGRGRGPLSIDVSGSRSFVDHVQMGEGPRELAAAAANQAHAAQVATRILGNGEPLKDTRGKHVGFMLRGTPSDEVAALLEGFAYTFHNPDPTRGIRWNLRSHYRAPNPDFPETPAILPPRSDPFLIAAFLRFWDDANTLCQADPSNNRFRGWDGLSTWRPCPAPSFNVAVRFGMLDPAEASPFRFRLLNRSVDPTGLVGSRWGGRGYGSAGDEWIDVAPASDDLGAPRPRGLPGLLLLHVVSREARGRSGDGEPYRFDRPCVGVVIPEGGPSILFVLAEDGSD